MEILLISPAGPADRLRRHRNITYAAMTLPMLAALAPEYANLTLVDEKVQEVDLSRRPDLVAISAITGTAPRSYELARHFRRRGSTVVMGGPHPTVLPEEALQHCDSVVLGQAYNTWPRCIEDFRNGRMKRLYQCGEPDYSDVPRPRRELLPRKRYFTVDTVQATFGCPNSCDFCIVGRVFGAGFHPRPLEQVIAEMETMESDRVFFLDTNLTAEPEYAKDLFREMIPLRKRWAAQVASDFTDDPELLDLAARAGCKGVFVGIESLNPRSLAGANKGFNQVDRYREIQLRLRAHGICSMFGIVFGFDEDSSNVFDTAMSFIDEVKADAVRYAILTPFPGTRLFQRLDAAGRIIDRNWEHYDTRHVVFRPARLTVDQLQAGFQRAWHHSYSISSMFHRVLGSRAYLPLSIAVNLGYAREIRRVFPRGRRRQFWPALR